LPVTGRDKSQERWKKEKGTSPLPKGERVRVRGNKENSKIKM
jgi:hypothetical protein